MAFDGLSNEEKYLRSLSDQALLSHFGRLVASERKITAQILETIKEINRRKLYVTEGFSSLFAWLTEKHGYTNGAAQRRIDAVRVLSEMPEIKADLQAGALNLSQVALIGTSVRQKERELLAQQKKQEQQHQKGERHTHWQDGVGETHHHDNERPAPQLELGTQPSAIEKPVQQFEIGALAQQLESEPPAHQKNSEMQVSPQETVGQDQRVKGERQSGLCEEKCKTTQNGQPAPKPKVSLQEKRQLLTAIKKLNFEDSQKIVAQNLELTSKKSETRRKQGDGSTRISITLTQEQMALITRVKELISHTHLNPSMAEVVELLAREFIRRKDPLAQKTGPTRRSRKSTSNSEVERVASETARGPLVSESQVEPRTHDPEESGTKVSESEVEMKSTATIARVGPCDSESEVLVAQSSNAKSHRRQASPRSSRYIKAHDRRLIHQRDQCCQWRSPATGRICASRFQLQVDHIASHCNGGTNEVGNLQLLCGMHNRMKFQLEMTAPSQELIERSNSLKAP